MSEMCSGVRTLIARMETNPEEFFRGVMKWHFMYESSFRDALTKAEKDALEKALVKVRRHEFDATVMEELTRDKEDFKQDSGSYTFNSSGQVMRLDSSGNLGIGVTSPTTFKSNIQIGNQTLTEDDIKNLKAQGLKWGFK